MEDLRPSRDQSGEWSGGVDSGSILGHSGVILDPILGNLIRNTENCLHLAVGRP